MYALTLLLCVVLAAGSQDVIFRNYLNITSAERPLYTVKLNFGEANSGKLVITCLRRAYGMDTDGCATATPIQCTRHGAALFVERAWKISHSTDTYKWYLETPYINETMFYNVINTMHNCSELKYAAPKIKGQIYENTGSVLAVTILLCLGLIII